MSSIVVPKADWSDEQVRRATLKEARKTARGSRTRVYIRVAHSKSYRVVMAVVDGRYYQS